MGAVAGSEGGRRNDLRGLVGDQKDRKLFWGTAPGILTGLAALITAIGGLLFILIQAGIIPIAGAPTPTTEPTTEKPLPTATMLIPATHTPTRQPTGTPTPTLTTRPPTLTLTSTSPPPTLGPVDCSRVSVGSEVPTTITFINKSSRTVQGFFVHENGNEEPYGNVSPGERWEQGTWVNHSWCLRDRDTQKAVLFVVATLGSQEVTIPDFSP